MACSAPLSPREIQCLTLLASGLTVAGLAQTFGTSPKTVEKQLFSARTKLRAATTIQAVVLAIRANLIETKIPGGNE